MDLKDLLVKTGYPFMNAVNLDAAINGGPKSIPFTEIAAWMSKELQVLCELENCINPICNPEDSISFLIEASSFFRELCCPLDILTEPKVSQRLLSRDDRIAFLEFLATELLASRILEAKHPSIKKKIIEVPESMPAKALKAVLINLGFSKPPPTITPIQLFTRVEGKLRDVISKSNVNFGEALFSGTLSERQWCALERLQSDMHEEYKARRNMLLTRFDVTMRSFCWSSKLKSKEGSHQMALIYDTRRSSWSANPSVHMHHLLAAREGLAIVEKTSSASVRQNTRSSINNVVIGDVPDRGGRPEEQQPPPPEVPSWQKNQPPRSSFSIQGQSSRFQQGNDSKPRFQQGGDRPRFQQMSDNRPRFQQMSDNRPRFQQVSDNRPRFQQGNDNKQRFQQVSDSKPRFQQENGSRQYGKGDACSTSGGYAVNKYQMPYDNSQVRSDPSTSAGGYCLNAYDLSKCQYTQQPDSRYYVDPTAQMQTVSIPFNQGYADGMPHIQGQPVFMPPEVQQTYHIPQFYSTDYSMNFGGYSATGGNFQQYGQPVNTGTDIYDVQGRRGRGGRGPRHRGGGFGGLKGGSYDYYYRGGGSNAR